ncbi:hypothetical protein [Streptomyces chrestomyceticus]|uniref:hypothetical protein n=1 Tax=Streptomyces chrestomyceticus TaxID=68185 RepID=UPI0035A98B08
MPLCRLLKTLAQGRRGDQSRENRSVDDLSQWDGRAEECATPQNANEPLPGDFFAGQRLAQL